MRSFRNIDAIQRKETLGRRLSLGGLGVLFVGLLASFVPTWYPPDAEVTGAIAQFLQQYWAWLSFAALPLGFILASVGSYYINRFARRRWPGAKTIARPDELFERNLKGFDDKYAYFAWSLPAHHVVAGPCGILVFALRGDKGRVIVQGDRWREPFSIGRIFTVFAREGVGNPSVELEEQTGKIRALLERANQTNGETDGPDNPEGGSDRTNLSLANSPIEGVAVFLNSQVDLTVENPSVPVLRVDQVKDYIRRKAKEAKLPANSVREMVNYLAEQSEYQTKEA